MSLFPLTFFAPGGLVANWHCCTQRIDLCCHHCIVAATARIDPHHRHHLCCPPPWHCCMYSTPILLSCHLPPDCTTHNQGWHPRNLTMTSAPFHNGPIFITMALLQQTKMKGDIVNNLISRHHHSQHAADSILSYRALSTTPWGFKE